jgi:hypothetical protein
MSLKEGITKPVDLQRASACGGHGLGVQVSAKRLQGFMNGGKRRRINKNFLLLSW